MGRSLGNIVHSARKSLRLDPLNAFIATTDVDAISAQRLAYHGERSAKGSLIFTLYAIFTKLKVLQNTVVLEGPSG